MELDTDRWYVAHDTTEVEIPTSNEGVTHDDEGVTVDWESVLTVDASSIPGQYTSFFDADSFYRFEDVTVTRSIPQTYYLGDEEYTFKKHPDALEQGAWSLDNKPFTIDHPDTPTGRVREVDDIRGFWRDGSHDAEANRTTATLYLPTDDETAKAHIDEHGSVSVGFTNRLEPTDEEGIDAYQTDIYYDHVASVTKGRCSDEDGCGFDHAVASDHGPRANRLMAASTETAVTTDQPSGIKSVDGRWFAVGPGEHTKDSTEYPGDHMFPVNSCEDINDAWGLRGKTKNLTISESTLESRIQRAAEAKSCDLPTTDSIETMTDSESEECGCNGGSVFDDIGAYSVDGLSEEHDGVATLIDEKAQLEEQVSDLQDAQDTLSEVREALDVAEDADLVERAEEIRSFYDEQRETERERLAEKITTHMDYEADDLAEEPLSELQRIEEVGQKAGAFETDAEEESSPTVVNSDKGGDGGSSEETDELSEDVIYNTAY